MGSVKISVNFPVDLISDCQTYADKYCISRTAAMTILIKRGLQQESLIESTSKLAGYYDAYLKTGAIPSDSDLESLQESIEK